MMFSALKAQTPEGNRGVPTGVTPEHKPKGQTPEGNRPKPNTETR